MSGRAVLLCVVLVSCFLCGAQAFTRTVLRGQQQFAASHSSDAAAAAENAQPWSLRGLQQNLAKAVTSAGDSAAGVKLPSGMTPFVGTLMRAVSSASGAPEAEPAAEATGSPASEPDYQDAALQMAQELVKQLSRGTVQKVDMASAMQGLTKPLDPKDVPAAVANFLAQAFQQLSSSTTPGSYGADDLESELLQTAGQMVDKMKMVDPADMSMSKDTPNVLTAKLAAFGKNGRAGGKTWVITGPGKYHGMQHTGPSTYHGMQHAPRLALPTSDGRLRQHGSGMVMVEDNWPVEEGPAVEQQGAAASNLLEDVPHMIGDRGHYGAGGAYVVSGVWGYTYTPYGYTEGEDYDYTDYSGAYGGYGYGYGW